MMQSWLTFRYSKSPVHDVYKHGEQSLGTFGVTDSVNVVVYHCLDVGCYWPRVRENPSPGRHLNFCSRNVHKTHSMAREFCSFILKIKKLNIPHVRSSNFFMNWIKWWPILLSSPLSGFFLNYSSLKKEAALKFHRICLLFLCTCS